jgi:hypothetical protein
VAGHVALPDGIHIESQGRTGSLTNVKTSRRLDATGIAARPSAGATCFPAQCATGKHCPEGWTLYALPGPQFASVTDSGSAEASYYTWIDQFDIFGLGRNVPIATGNENESLLALVDGKFVNLRVPYPLGYYTKWMDGRIDDPNAGWRGKGKERAPEEQNPGGREQARPNAVQIGQAFYPTCADAERRGRIFRPP